MVVGGQHHAPAALPLGKQTRYQLRRRLGVTQVRSERVRKTSQPGAQSPYHWTTAAPSVSCRRKVALSNMMAPVSLFTHSFGPSSTTQIHPLPAAYNSTPPTQALTLHIRIQLTYCTHVFVLKTATCSKTHKICILWESKIVVLTTDPV
jgi:hypothetical protein